MDHIRHLSLKAPAKINLILMIKGRRQDGYHEIVTLMQKLDLADTLEITVGSGKGVSLFCPGSDLPVDERNIAFRAAGLFLKSAGIATGVKIILKKHIPVAAGLGGGSSDAAAVLRGLSILCNQPDKAKLMVMAGSLGADVPFFVSDYNAAWAFGIGEQLRKAGIYEKGLFLLINPGFPVSTKWAYENFALTLEGNTFNVGPEWVRQNTFKAVSIPEKYDFFNHLESVTARQFPEITSIKKGLLADGARDAIMSGSGPTVFGIFEKEKTALRSFSKFKKRYMDNVFLARSLAESNISPG